MTCPFCGRWLDHAHGCPQRLAEEQAFEADKHRRETEEQLRRIAEVNEATLEEARQQAARAERQNERDEDERQRARESERREENQRARDQRRARAERDRQEDEERLDENKRREASADAVRELVQFGREVAAVSRAMVRPSVDLLRQVRALQDAIEGIDAALLEAGDRRELVALLGRVDDVREKLEQSLGEDFTKALDREEAKRAADAAREVAEHEEQAAVALEQRRRAVVAAKRVQYAEALVRARHNVDAIFAARGGLQDPAWLDGAPPKPNIVTTHDASVAVETADKWLQSIFDAGQEYLGVDGRMVRHHIWGDSKVVLPTPLGLQRLEAEAATTASRARALREALPSEASNGAPSIGWVWLLGWSLAWAALAVVGAVAIRTTSDSLSLSELLTALLVAGWTVILCVLFARRASASSRTTRWHAVHDAEEAMSDRADALEKEREVAFKAVAAQAAAEGEALGAVHQALKAIDQLAEPEFGKFEAVFDDE